MDYKYFLDIICYIMLIIASLGGCYFIGFEIGKRDEYKRLSEESEGILSRMEKKINKDIIDQCR